MSDDRDVILRRRRQLVTAAFSAVTLSSAAARAQICLSVDQPDPPPCSLDEDRLEREPSPELVLEAATCLVEREHQLEKALAYFRRYLELTADDEETRDQRHRVAWTIERIEIVLADQGKIDREEPPPSLEESPAPRPSPKGALAPRIDRLSRTAPASAGPATCGCHHQPPPGGQAAWLAGAAAALLRRRWSRRR